MASVNYTIRLDEADKKSAEKVFDQLGLTLAAGLNVYLKAVARLQKIPFELSLTDQSAAMQPITNKTKTQSSKNAAFNVLRGILAGYEIDVQKERDERLMLK